MSSYLDLTFPFLDPSGHTFDSTKIDFQPTVPRLKLIDLPNLDFNEPFDSDTGFTYNSNLSEFTGGLVRQKDKAPINFKSWVTYTSNINLNYGGGTLTGTAAGSAAVSGNKLDLAHNDIRYVTYNAVGNANMQQSGAIKFKVTPNYSGNPASDQNICFIQKAFGDTTNLVAIKHATGDAIKLIIYNSVGGSIMNTTLGTWNPTALTSYEFELNFDITTGATRLFINGVQFGSTQTNTGVRDSNIGIVLIGTNTFGTATSNFYIEDLIFYDAVQHTANYTPGYTLEEYRYVANNIVCPEMEYTGVGTLQLFSAFTVIDSNTPKYTIQVGRSGNYVYWDGAAWSISDGTPAQANDATTFNANVASLDIEGEIYGQFKIHFDNNNTTQMSVSDLTATVTGQTYPVDNPTIEPDADFDHEGLVNLTKNFVITGSDDIRIILKNEDTWKYWNGSAWATSDGTSYSQASTIDASFLSGLSSFTTTKTTTKIKLFFHSADGTTTPIGSAITIRYDFADRSADTINRCRVYGYCLDNEGSPVIGDGYVYASLEDAAVQYKTDVVLYRKTFTATIRSTDGYFEFDGDNALPETENANWARYKFTLPNMYIYGGVPDENSKEIWSINNVSKVFR